MRRLTAVIVGLATGATLGGCGSESAGGDVVPTSAAAPDSYRATAMVLESPAHGPELCLGGVNESFPPQCGGVPLTPWDWADHPDTESANGTTWGTYTVTGRYNGKRMTVESAEPPDPVDDPDPGSDEFGSPCEPPAGGWAVVEPDLTSDASMDAALTAAAAEPDYVMAWLDQSINPAADATEPAIIEAEMNDPTKLVLNLRFTGDLDRHEREIREIWGGALCISAAERTEAELLAIMDEVMDVAGDQMLSAGSDPLAGTVELHVVLDDGSLQARLDEAYGAGVVVVTSALQPAG